MNRAALALVETELRLRKAKLQAERDSLLEHQRKPDVDFFYWLMMGGRGIGKTHAGAHHTMEHLREYKKDAWPIAIAPTIGDARSVILEGPSGIWTNYRHEFVEYNRSLLTLKHVSGGILKVFGGEVPDRLRGPQSSFLWIDELPVMPAETVEQALFGLRLGDPWALFTTTPRPTRLMKEIIADPLTVITRAHTRDNPHLAESAVRRLEAKFGGTRLGRQELEGELLEEAEGALWRMATIELNRVLASDLPQVVRTVVAVDPAVTNKPKSDETGLAVASKCVDMEYYTRASEGLRSAPHVWARRTIELFQQFEADLIVTEVNNGGDMVEETIRAVWPDAPIKQIRASKGKTVRAEPVALLYEQNKVHHVGVFAALEDQMINFGYGVTPEHDDRLDSNVYAITELMEEDTPLLFGRIGG